MELQGSSQCSQESAIGSCAKLEEKRPQPSNLSA